MAIIRRFDVDPGLQAFMAFVGSRVQQEAENERIEAQAQQRNREQLAGAIGGAVGDIGSAPFQRQLLQEQQGIKQQDALSLIGARGDQGLRRDQARFEQQIQAYLLEQTGTTTDSLTAKIIQDSAARPQQVADTQFLAPGDVDAAAGLPLLAQSGAPASLAGPPAPGALPFAVQEQQAQQGAAQQLQADQDAGFRLDFTPQAKAKIMQLEGAAVKIEEDDSLSDDEKAAAYEQIKRQKSRIRRTKIPVDRPQMTDLPVPQLIEKGFVHFDKDTGTWILPKHLKTAKGDTQSKHRSPVGDITDEAVRLAAIDLIVKESVRPVRDESGKLLGMAIIGPDGNVEKYDEVNAGRGGEEDIGKKIAALIRSINQKDPEGEARRGLTGEGVPTPLLIKEEKAQEKQEKEFALLSEASKVGQEILDRAEAGEDVSQDVGKMMDAINLVYPTTRDFTQNAPAAIKEMVVRFVEQGLLGAGK